jgi:MFS family permease
VPAGATERAAASFDLQGAALLLALLTGVATLLTVLDELPVAVTLAGVAAVAVGAAAFTLVERRQPDPVLRPGLLGRGPFGAAVGAVTLANLSLYGTLLAVPLLFSASAGWSELRIGLVLTSVSVAMIVASVLGGRLADRVERRQVAVAGFALFGLGLLPLAVALEDVATVVLVAGLAVAGVGAGLANPALQAAALDAVEDGDAAVASGVYSTGRYLGGIVAASLLAVAVGGSADGFGLVLGVCVAAAFASAALALALPGRAVQAAYTTRLRA